MTEQNKNLREEVQRTKEEVQEFQNDKEGKIMTVPIEFCFEVKIFKYALNRTISGYCFSNSGSFIR